MQSPTAAVEEALRRTEAGAERAKRRVKWNGSGHCVTSGPVMSSSFVSVWISPCVLGRLACVVN